MANSKVNSQIKIDNSIIIETVNEVVSNCYGVDNFVCDSNENNTKGTASSGVSIRKHSDRTYSIDVYLAMASDVKITESLREAQKRLRYTVDKKFPGKFRNVNVFVSEVKLK